MNAPNLIARSGPESGPQPSGHVPGEHGGSLYAARRRIHPRQVSGRYQRIRLLVRCLLLGGLFVLPWLQWQGQPLVWLDLPTRHFYVFGSTFFSDDLFIAGWLLIIAAFALFTFTNIAGRVVCGYACPHSMYFSLFIAVEEFVEGTALQRRRRDQQRAQRAAGVAPAGRFADPEQLAARVRRFTTYVVWLLLALAFAFSVTALFVPAQQLAQQVSSATVSGWTLFWLTFLTTGCFAFAGFLREQACFYMCPYARFQAAMFDDDTLVVTYDAARGEPRAAAKRGAEKHEPSGDCVDCHLCVDVCPVGIDIRMGLQYQCIQCGLCVDACAPVMQRLGRPAGLIRYATQNLVERKQAPFRLGRPRLLGYAAVLTAMSALFIYYMSARVPFDLEVIRERNSLYREVVSSVEMGSVALIENGYRLEIANKTDGPRRFELAARGPAEIQWVGAQAVDAGPGEILELPVRLRMLRSALKPGITNVRFELSAIATGGTREVLTREQRFFGPSS